MSGGRHCKCGQIAACPFDHAILRANGRRCEECPMDCPGLPEPDVAGWLRERATRVRDACGDVSCNFCREARFLEDAARNYEYEHPVYCVGWRCDDEGCPHYGTEHGHAKR